MLTIPPAPSSPPTSSASGTLRSPSAPTVRVRSRPQVTTKHPSVHVQTSGGRSRPPFKFVRAQSSRPNPPSVHARPRPSLRPTASISGHRSGSFTTRGHDQTRPAFASVRVVRSRPPFAFVHDQRSRPNTTSVHDQTPRFLCLCRCSPRTVRPGGFLRGVSCQIVISRARPP